MVHTGLPLPQSSEVHQSVTFAYLESRVREEADAAASARSIEATIVHVLLATRYAERLTQCSGQNTHSADQSWVEDHRLW